MNLFSVVGYLALRGSALLSWYLPLFAVVASVVLLCLWFVYHQAFCFRAAWHAVKGASLPLVCLFLGGWLLLFPMETPGLIYGKTDVVTALARDNPSPFSLETTSLSSYPVLGSDMSTSAQMHDRLFQSASSVMKEP